MIMFYVWKNSPKDITCGVRLFFAAIKSYPIEASLHLLGAVRYSVKLQLSSMKWIEMEESFWHRTLYL